jgi:hypothetical protein
MTLRRQTNRHSGRLFRAETDQVIERLGELLRCESIVFQCSWHRSARSEATGLNLAGFCEGLVPNPEDLVHWQDRYKPVAD